MVSTVSEALSALSGPDSARRCEAAAFLGQHASPLATEVLLGALGDPNVAVQEAVIQALVQQRQPDQIPLLVKVLLETNPLRRNGALSVLLDISRSDPEMPVHSLRHASPEVRQWAAEILGDLVHPDAVPALIERLEDAAEFPNVRRAAAQSLGRLGQAEATPALLDAAAHGDFWMRHAAIDALSRLADERAVGPLITLMKQDAWTRPSVIKALGNIGHADAVAELVIALDDGNEAVRAASLEALFKIVMEPTGPNHSSPRAAQLQAQIPLEPLRRELAARLVPNSAYAAHLLGWLGRPEALSDLLEALHSADDPIRDAAMEASLRFGATALPVLITALARPEPILRERAVELIGLVGDQSVAPVLAEYLRDSQMGVRLAVLRALGALGGEAAYAGLLQAVTDPATREAALAVIEQITAPAAVDELKAYLQRYLYESKGVGALRWAAAQALSLLGDEAAVSILLNAMRLPDDTIRRPAADALARVRGRRAVNVLIEALGDRDWLVRQKAIHALSSIQDSRVVAALVPLTRDPEWRVRWSLAGALGRLRDARIYPPLRELAQDRDHWVRRMALDVCGRLDDARAIEIVARGLQDAEPQVRLAALLALQPQRGQAPIAPVADLTQDPDPEVRRTAARTLALVAGASAVDALTLLAHDPVEGVRAEIGSVLGELGSDEGLNALELLLRDPAAEVRRRAGEALAHLGTHSAGEALADALTHAVAGAEARARLLGMGEIGLRVLLATARSADPELRVAAAQALGQARDRHAQPTLKQMLRDTDHRVRRAAEEALAALAAA